MASVGETQGLKVAAQVLMVAFGMLALIDQGTVQDLKRHVTAVQNVCTPTFGVPCSELYWGQSGRRSSEDVTGI